MKLEPNFSFILEPNAHIRTDISSEKIPKEINFRRTVDRSISIVLNFSQFHIINMRVDEEHSGTKYLFV